MSETRHRYAATCAWRGSTGDGYEAYDRTHQASAPPAGESFELSSDPAFRGDPNRLNPETLIVIAASSCQLLSFLAVAARARVDVIEYHDNADGEMSEADRPMWITRIVLHPRITVRGDVTTSRLAHLVEVAHRECYVANSLRTDIVVEPTFVSSP